MQYISSTCFFVSYTIRTIVKSHGEYLGKLLAENRCMKILKEFLLGKGDYHGKFGAGNRYIDSVQRSWKSSRLGTGIFWKTAGLKTGTPTDAQRSLETRLG
jgi:hypothetical protein